MTWAPYSRVQIFLDNKQASISLTLHLRNWSRQPVREAQIWALLQCYGT